MARRQVRRTLLSSALITTLIMLPIATMTGFAVITASTVATPSERVANELGRTQAWIAVKGVPDRGFWQIPLEPDFIGYPSDAIEISGTPLADPTTLLPAGTTSIAVTRGSARVRTSDGIATVKATTGTVWDTSLTGRFALVDGHVPRGDAEALVTPAALTRLGLKIGEELVLADDGESFTVTGTLRSATDADSVAAVFLPASAAIRGEKTWYLPDLSLEWSAVQKLNDSGVVALSRAVLENPPDMRGTDADRAYDRYWASRTTMLTMLGAGGAFCAYVVIMLAGAAFAVSARRQQRALAIAASVGAAAGDLRRVVLLQGTVLGILGGAVGMALGIGGAAVIMGAVSDGSATQFPGFHVPWEILALVFIFAVIVGTISAWLPARTVARSDTLSALRGARRPQTPHASRPIWGSALLVLGVAVTLGAGALMLVVNSTTPADSPLRVIGPIGIVVGPIVMQIGLLVSGRWLLRITSRVLSLVGLSARLASRDASANAARTVPAFAAIAATVFIGVFAVGSIGMQNADNARQWYYQAPVGSMAVTFSAPGMGELPELTKEQRSDAAAAAVELARSAGATAVAVVGRQPNPWEYGRFTDGGDDVVYASALMPEEHLITTDSFRSHGQDPTNPISVVSADEIETALGTTLTTGQMQAYRDGAALAADPRFVTSNTITVSAWSGRVAARDELPSNIWPESPDAPWAPSKWERTIDAIPLDLPSQPVVIAITPERADELGIVPYPVLIVAGFPDAVASDVRDRVAVQADSLSSSDWTLFASWEDGPTDDSTWMIPILTAVTTLVLGASAVALGLARVERRPDDATLSAIGATGALRRRVGFWQGLIIAGFGTVAGAAAGILPPIGIAIQSAGALQLTDVPWVVLGSVVIALPLAIAFVSWIVPPQRPDLTRRTVIA